MAQEDYSAIAASAPANPVPANLAESHPRKILEYAFWKVKDIPFLEHSLALLPLAGHKHTVSLLLYLGNNHIFLHPLLLQIFYTLAVSYHLLGLAQRRVYKLPRQKELLAHNQERAEFRIVRDVHKHLVFLEHSLALLPPAGQLPPDHVLLVTKLLEFWFLSVLHRLHLPFWR